MPVSSGPSACEVSAACTDRRAMSRRMPIDPRMDRSARLSSIESLAGNARARATLMPTARRAPTTNDAARDCSIRQVRSRSARPIERHQSPGSRIARLPTEAVRGTSQRAAPNCGQQVARQANRPQHPAENSYGHRGNRDDDGAHPVHPADSRGTVHPVLARGVIRDRLAGRDAHQQVVFSWKHVERMTEIDGVRTSHQGRGRDNGDRLLVWKLLDGLLQGQIVAAASERSSRSVACDGAQR